MQAFQAYRVHKTDAGPRGRLDTIELDDLNPGAVTVRVTWSGINYKDALAATGAGRIMKDFPTVAGVDAVGEVVDSDGCQFEAGDAVVITGAGLGELRDGGFAEFLRADADMLVPLPASLSQREAALIGTAGFTAALAVERMQHNGQQPDAGPIAVTGPNGGVGSMAVDMLAAQGFTVQALTSKPGHEDYLRGLGAAEVLDLKATVKGERPLEKAVLGGAVDNLGGATLSWLLRSTRQDGNVASIGLVESAELHTSVMPLILRGVNLLGINSVIVPTALRRRVWQRLGEDLRPRHLDAIGTREVTLDELDGVFGDYLNNRVQGRTLVRVAG